MVFDSNAITKIQSVILAVIIIVAAVAGSLAYILLGRQGSSETVKIGVFEDMDMLLGKQSWQGAVLAAEHVNAKGGILGRQVEVIGEDNDWESGMDMTVYMSALNRLLNYHKVDFVLGIGNEILDVVAEQKKILFAAMPADDIEQRVLNDYERYKYLFVHNWNTTSGFQGITDSIKTVSENTNLTKVAFIAEDKDWAKGMIAGLENALSALYGYETVYKGTYPMGTVDFTSYFALAEAAGAEILIPLCNGQEGLSMVKEWYDRQSPMIIYSGLLSPVTLPEAWEWTEGKCISVSVSQIPIAAEYPFTSKTLQLREAYIERWGETPGFPAAITYDILRYVLPAAIERAGTIETEAVIEALEQTSVETSQARTFAYSSSHGVMMGENPNNPDAEYMIVMVFQWQNGKLVPVHPQKVMEEAGVSLIFPPWSGPWDR